MPDAQYLPALTYFHAFVLGIVQGITEFLPVSSTAHIRILPALLRWPDPGLSYSAIVQLGPIVAVVAYFRQDLLRYVAGIGRSLQQRVLFPVGDSDARLGWFTVLGTVPLIVFGLALNKSAEEEYRNLFVVAAALIVLAFVMLIAESRARQVVTLEKLTLRDALIVGLAQALAIVPGASRSGTTITVGLFLGLTREDAARFSFLLSIPAITLGGLYKLAETLHHTHIGSTILPYLFSSLVAGVFAYVVIKLFLGYLENEKHTTMPFIIYRILLGIALLVLASTGFVVPKSH